MVLDDLELHHSEIRKHQVQINAIWGLSQNDIQAALEILQR